MNWKILNNKIDLEEMLEQSKQKNLLIFKHSPRCGTSRFAIRNFEKEYNESEEIETLYLDVLESRSLSNKIADRLNIHHESPQAIFIKKGEVVYHASHDNIDAHEVLKLVSLN